MQNQFEAGESGDEAAEAGRQAMSEIKQQRFESYQRALAKAPTLAQHVERELRYGTDPNYVAARYQVSQAFIESAQARIDAAKAQESDATARRTTGARVFEDPPF